MIKNYKQFNESVLSKLEGPSETEIWDGIKDLSPDDILFKSAKIGYLEGVKKAIKMGANIENDKSAALYISTKNGNLDIVKYLVQKDVDIDGNNHAAIINAVENNHLDIVKYLVEQGANISFFNNNLLGISKWLKNKEMVHYLEYAIGNNKNYESVLSKLEGPSEEEALDSLYKLGLTPNNLFARSCRQGILLGVKKAMEDGCDISAYEEHSDTSGIIQQPLVEETPITYEDEQCALEHVIQNKDMEIFNYIFDNCDVEEYIEYGELMELCSVHANIEIAKILIENGADINDDNRNILSIAVANNEYNSHYGYIEFLLENGANPNIHDGFSIKTAKKKDDIEIIELLNRFK